MDGDPIVGKTLRVPFTTDESTSVTATLNVGRKTAKATEDFGAAGRHTLTIKVSKAIRRLRLARAASSVVALANWRSARTWLGAGAVWMLSEET